MEKLRVEPQFSNRIDLLEWQPEIVSIVLYASFIICVSLIIFILEVGNYGPIFKNNTKKSDILVFFGNMAINSLAYREFRVRGKFLTSVDLHIPSGQWEFIRIFSQKSRMSISILFSGNLFILGYFWVQSPKGISICKFPAQREFCIPYVSN